MTDENLETEQSRRKFLKTTGAVGVAATTGVAAFGGQAAAQSVNAQQLFGSGLVVVQGVNVQDTVDIGDVTVTILDDADIDVTVTNVDVLSDNVIKILNDVTVQDNLNQNQVTVQVSVLGDIVGTDTVNAPANL